MPHNESSRKKIKKPYTRKETIRLKGFDYSSERVYFVTLVVKNRRRVFLNKRLASTTIDCLIQLRRKMNFNLYCYCLMPDHLHALIGAGKSNKSLGDICGAFKSISTRISWKWLDGKLWQRQYFDHIVRNEEDFFNCVTYIKRNPVIAGLVENWDDWAFTSRVDYLR